MDNITSVFGGKDFKKKLLIRRFPKLKNKEFDMKEEPKKCVECSKENLVSYYVKVDGKEWRLVPETENEICLECEDRKLAREAFAAHKQLKYRYLWRLTRELEKASLENYNPHDEHTIKAMGVAERYIRDFIDGDQYNLFWVGSYGVGKSHLSKAIAERVKKERKNGNEFYTTGFVSVDDVLTMIKASWDDKKKSEKEIMEDLKELDLLVLDELGTNDQKTDWAKGTINEIINSRNGKPTIYTTNLSIDELENVLDGRTVDRLHQNTKMIEIYTKSYRRQQTR